jgi:hypothetical protein
VNERRQALNPDWEDGVEEGYIGVEGLGGGERAAHEGGRDLGSPQKASHWGSILANKMWGAVDSDWGDAVEEGYIRVEELGGRKQAAREGGGSWAENRKPSRRGSVLANDMREALNLSWGDVVGEGYNGVDGLGGGYQVGRDGWGNLPENRKPSGQCSVLAEETQGAPDSD